MKNKTAPKKTTAKKTVKRTIPRTSRNQESTLFIHRLVIISACLVLFVGIAATFNKGFTSQAVAGVSIMRGLFAQTTVQLPSTPGAASYNIYYRQVGEQRFTNAVRNIPSNVTSYTISYLKKGVNYEYRYTTVNQNGQEFVFSDIKPLTDLQSM